MEETAALAMELQQQQQLVVFYSLFFSHPLSCSESQVQCCCRQLKRVMERFGGQRTHNGSHKSNKNSAHLLLAAAFSSIIRPITVTVRRNSRHCLANGTTMSEDAGIDGRWRKELELAVRSLESVKLASAATRIETEREQKREKAKDEKRLLL